MKIKFSIIIIVFFLFSFPVNLLAAQVLQVRSSSTLLIGDRNRTFTVKIACIEVEQDQEEMAKYWLKDKVSGKKRVNLMPTGSQEGILLAKVISIDSKEDLGKGLVDEGFARSECN